MCCVHYFQTELKFLMATKFERTFNMQFMFNFSFISQFTIIHFGYFLSSVLARHRQIYQKSFYLFKFFCQENAKKIYEEK